MSENIERFCGAQNLMGHHKGYPLSINTDLDSWVYPSNATFGLFYSSVLDEAIRRAGDKYPIDYIEIRRDSVFIHSRRHATCFAALYPTVVVRVD